MSELKYTVLDLETSVKCPIGSNKANPHWPENKIVMGGYGRYDHPIIISKSDCFNWTEYPKGWLLVGSNIPFDLKYVYRDYENLHEQRGNIRVWDCQIAEYLLTRQRTKYASLDQMSTKYGGTVKPSDIKAHWDSGGQTEDIDPAKLEKYLRGDISNTKLVFKAQLKEAVERGMLPLVMAHMDAAMAITEMEYNGIAINKEFVEEQLRVLARKIDISKVGFKEYVLKNSDIPAELINIDSPKSLSLILFGGTVKEDKKELAGYYKNGKPKFKTVKVDKAYKGFGRDTTGLEKTVHGWSTDETTLVALFKMGCPVSTFIDTYRDLVKNFSTYYLPIYQLTFPDGRIHPNLNQTATETGRLSCTEPNLQNQTDKHKSEVKKSYVSRWGKDGLLVEFDYQQLEIYALAELTEDKQLIADLASGIDIHTNLFRNMYGRLPTEWERKQFKRLSFALIYGSGIKNMAQQAVVPENVARNFKRTFEFRYPEVVRYRQKVRDKLLITRVANGHGHDKETGLPLASSFYRLPTGRELYYREFVQAKLGNKVDFSYTQICNYPVQSYATGDIVPIMLGRLWRRLVLNTIYKDKVLLVNTVHDSILLDIHKDLVKEVIPVIKEILEEVPEVMKQIFNIDMATKPKVSVSAGPDWFEQSEIK